VKPLRVLHVHTLPVVSGSGINTFLTMKRTPRACYETALACAPGGMLNQIVRGAGMTVYEVPHMVQPLHPIKDVLALRQLVRIIREEKIAIVHTHNSKAGFLGRLAGRMAGAPVVIHSVHGFAFHDAESWWRRFLFRRLERMAASWADHTIFISEPMIGWARREGILARTAYSKIYSGIDLSAFQQYERSDRPGLRQELGLGEDDRVIGFVSKLWEGKGHTVALEAMVLVLVAFPRAKLLLVGEGPLAGALQAQSRTLGIESSVVFAGFRTRVAELTWLCDFCILPSFYEGMGRVLLEAGACSKPVVASRVGGIPDVVVDNETGFLVPPGDPEALASAMMRLLEDRDLLARMGARAREYIGEKFDARTMVEEVVKLYDLYADKKKCAAPGVKPMEVITEKHNHHEKVG
jgi:glycosyltransferase involved in cell wall biosynthesis